MIRHAYRDSWAKLLLGFASVALLSCANAPQGTDAFQRMNANDAQATQAPTEKLLIVDCLTPPQIRRLGALAQTLTPRRAIKASQAECEAYGGEYVASNTNPRDALKLWLPFAEQGDLDAQVQVGELFEKGANGKPDYVSAAQWYERAAKLGYSRAKVNLAALLEHGQGVSRDVPRAQRLFREISGLPPALASVDKPRIQLIEPASLLSGSRLRSASSAAIKAQPGPITVAGRVSSSLAIDRVEVNGQKQTVDTNGLFSTTLTLRNEPLPVAVAAVDASGNRSLSEFLLSAQAGAAAANASSSVKNSASRYALVIANQNYSKGYEKLDTPHADGRAIKSLLEVRYGFQVNLLLDATRRDVLLALNNLRLRVGAGDQILVYYAGHGEMDGITQRGYWIPVDGERRNVSNWISVVDITDQLNAMPARQVMVVADSCYSGTMTRSAVPAIDQQLAEDAQRSAIAQLGNQRSRVVMTSGGLEPVIDGGGGRNSLFARSFIDVLTHINTPMEAQQVHTALSARFLYLSRRLNLQQRPEYGPLRFAGHESGDFVFVPRL
jgi:uncharacterized protein